MIEPDDDGLTLAQQLDFDNMLDFDDDTVSSFVNASGDDRSFRAEMRDIFKPVVEVPKQHFIIGQDPKQVLDEFEKLMQFESQKPYNSDTRKRYKMYLKELFDGGVFNKRDELFNQGAKARAHKFYMQQAIQVHSKGGKTPLKKLYHNYKNGYDKFVLLSDNHSGHNANDETIDADELLKSVSAEMDAISDEAFLLSVLE